MKTAKTACAAVVMGAALVATGCTKDADNPPTPATASTTVVATPTPTDTLDAEAVEIIDAYEEFIDAYNVAYNNHLQDWMITVLPLTGGEFQAQITEELTIREGAGVWSEGGLKVVYAVPAGEAWRSDDAAVLEVCIDRRNLAYHWDGNTKNHDDSITVFPRMQRQPDGSWAVWSSQQEVSQCG